MADGFWNRRQQTLIHSGVLKRPRVDYDLSTSGQLSGREMHNYFARDDDCDGLRTVKDTRTIGSAYDRYLQSAIPSGETNTLGGVGLGRSFAGGIPSRPTTDHLVLGRGAVPDLAQHGRSTVFEDQLPIDTLGRAGRDAAPLPRDASSTLYVEGLPSDSTRREVSHIFRPFVGYKEVRLVSKESRHRGGEPLILCFVDFASPACAATALSALQGYKMDEHNLESSHLRLQFSRFPGPRSASGPRGKR